MRKFFKSVRQVMKAGGLVKVSTNELSTGVDAKDMVTSAELLGFKLKEQIIFNDWELSDYDRAFGDYRDVSKRNINARANRGGGKTSDKYCQSAQKDYLYVFEMLDQEVPEAKLLPAPSPSEVYALNPFSKTVINKFETYFIKTFFIPSRSSC